MYMTITYHVVMPFSFHALHYAPPPSTVLVNGQTAICFKPPARTIRYSSAHAPIRAPIQVHTRRCGARRCSPPRGKKQPQRRRRSPTP